MEPAVACGQEHHKKIVNATNRLNDRLALAQQNEFREIQEHTENEECRKIIEELITRDDKIWLLRSFNINETEEGVDPKILIERYVTTPFRFPINIKRNFQNPQGPRTIMEVSGTYRVFFSFLDPSQRFAVKKGYEDPKIFRLLDVLNDSYKDLNSVEYRENTLVRKLHPEDNAWLNSVLGEKFPEPQYYQLVNLLIPDHSDFKFFFTRISAGKYRSWLSIDNCETFNRISHGAKLTILLRRFIENATTMVVRVFNKVGCHVDPHERLNVFNKALTAYTDKDVRIGEEKHSIVFKAKLRPEAQMLLTNYVDQERMFPLEFNLNELTCLRVNLPWNITRKTATGHTDIKYQVRVIKLAFYQTISVLIIRQGIARANVYSVYSIIRDYVLDPDAYAVMPFRNFDRRTEFKRYDVLYELRCIDEECLSLLGNFSARLLFNRKAFWLSIDHYVTFTEIEDIPWATSPLLTNFLNIAMNGVIPHDDFVPNKRIRVIKRQEELNLFAPLDNEKNENKLTIENLNEQLKRYPYNEHIKQELVERKARNKEIEEIINNWPEYYAEHRARLRQETEFALQERNREWDRAREEREREHEARSDTLGKRPRPPSPSRYTPTYTRRFNASPAPK